MTFPEGLNLFFLWLGLLVLVGLLKPSKAINIPQALGDSEHENYSVSVGAFIRLGLRKILYVILVLLWGYLLLYAFGFALIILIGISFYFGGQLWQQKFVSSTLQNLDTTVLKLIPPVMSGFSYILWLTAFVFLTVIVLFWMLFYGISYAIGAFLITTPFIILLKLIRLKRVKSSLIIVLYCFIACFCSCTWILHLGFNLERPSKPVFLEAVKLEGICKNVESIQNRLNPIQPLKIYFAYSGLEHISLTGNITYYRTDRNTLTISPDSRHLVWSSQADRPYSTNQAMSFIYLNRDTDVSTNCVMSTPIFYDVYSSEQNIEPIFLDISQNRIFTTTRTQLIGALESTEWIIEPDGVHPVGISGTQLFYTMFQNRFGNGRCGRDSNSIEIPKYLQISDVVYDFLMSSEVQKSIPVSNWIPKYSSILPDFILYSIRLDCLGENLIIVTSRGTFLFEVEVSSSNEAN